jgi:purine catabolism regulator
MQMNIAPLTSVSLNQIQFLLPEGGDASLLWQQLVGPDLAFGLSRAYQGVDGIRQAYQEALGLLPHLRRSTFLRYEDLLLPRVLLGDTEAQRVFLDDLLKPLSGRRGGAVLVETLIAFAQAGFHLKRTAELLHIHPKSLRYRLNRATELCHLDLNDSETRFRLQLAMHLLGLEEHVSGERFIPPR